MTIDYLTTMVGGDYLEHYGVRGMRWGVRRGHGPYGQPRMSRRQARKQKAAEISSMSDAELRARLNRLQMEKQYKQLSSENDPGAIGKQFLAREARQIVLNTAEQEAAKYLRKGIRAGVSAAVKRRR